MTTNQTIDGVPRELLESFAAYVADSPNAVMRSRAAQLRALLDAPVNPLSEIEVLRAAVKELEAMRDARVDAKLAQPQGEPVALKEAYEEGFSDGSRAGDDQYNWEGFRDELAKSWPVSDACKLYAEQPAPVAVAMPEHKRVHPGSPLYAEAEQWNACLDEVTRLNTK